MEPLSIRPPGTRGPTAFVASLILTMACTLSAVGADPPVQGIPPVHPRKGSVVLIVVDALNASHLGSYGYHRDTTPNLDALAATGVRFSRWVASAPWTRPAFTTILTGVPASVHQVELDDARLRKSFITLAEAFKGAGYRTGAFIGNPLIGRKWNHHQGFETFVDSEQTGPFPAADVLVNRAIEWLARADNRPVFLCLFLTDPHAPYDPPQDARHFSADFSEILQTPPREVADPLPTVVQEGLVSAYDDEVRHADAQAGVLLGWLDASGYADATVAVTADHGEMFGQHGCYQHAWHMWEEVLRVPFILRSPRVEGRNVVVTEAAGHEDLAPTLLHLSDIPVPPGMTGTSVFIRPETPRPCTSAYDAQGVRRVSVRHNDWKLIRYERVNRQQLMAIGGEGAGRYPSLSVPAPRVEVYDLENDPTESNNLQGTSLPAPVTALMRLLQPTTAQPRRKAAPAPIDKETLDALKAAGYIEK